MKLIIANKTHSSWSLRPWLVLKQFGIPFEEVLIPFGPTMDDPGWKRAVADYTPARKVPSLVDGAIAVWDSLAIIEYIAETHPELPIWPRDKAELALASSISAEMHSSFTALRGACPMNLAWVHPARVSPRSGAMPASASERAAISCSASSVLRTRCSLR